LEKHAIVLAEAVVADVGEVLDVLDLGFRTPALLREGQVEADGVGRGLVTERLKLGAETPGLRVANGRVERRHHVEETGLAGGLRQADDAQTGAYAREIGGLVARLELGSGQLDGIALEEHGS